MHQNKNCELGRNITRSYISIPAFTDDCFPKIVNDNEIINCDHEEIAPMPFGLLRITFDEKGCASRAEKLLNENKNLLHKIFQMLKKGYSSVMKNWNNAALAIADLQTDLLKYRANEFAALDELAFHIQTLFGDCECSIFLAHKRATKSRDIFFDLYLAATTAQTSEVQHRKFRKTFFAKVNSYACQIGGNNTNDSDVPKTVKAFLNPDVPVCVNDNLGSRLYHQKGEIMNPGSFLGLAIPPSKQNTFPYGVIRIVREDAASFNGRDRLLAAAIAKALTYWLDFFPKNEDLRIEWSKELSKKEILKKLFNLGQIVGNAKSNLPLRKAELEFSWLLQKIFFSANKIILKQLFGGKSGAVVIRVVNDSGLDLILKCTKREGIAGSSENIIWREISNYKNYIEGKLDLNHNVIYRELIRETRELVGFATSFLHCRNRTRISITEFCKRERENLNVIEWSLTRVIERIFTGVCQWWYDPKQVGEIPNSKNIKEFVFAETINKDSLFRFFNNMEKFDRIIFPKLNISEGLQTFFKSIDAIPSPRTIWDNFRGYMENDSVPISWYETVTHGDAHGDNVFFDPESLEIWMIDFSRTAKRVSIFDLAMIESDLKFRHFPNIVNDDNIIAKSEFLTIYAEFEKSLASQNTYEVIIIPGVNDSPILRMIAKLIVDIRQLACQKLMRTGSFNDYQIILFLLAFKFMKIQDVSKERILLPYLSAYTIQNEKFSKHQVDVKI